MDDENKKQPDREEILRQRQARESYYVELDRQIKESERQQVELTEELKRQEEVMFRSNPEAVVERLEKLKEADDMFKRLFLTFLFVPFLLAGNIISISLDIPHSVSSVVQTRQAVLCFFPSGPKRFEMYALKILSLSINLESPPYIPFNKVPEYQRSYLPKSSGDSTMVNVFDGEFLSRGGRRGIRSCVHLDDVSVIVSYKPQGLLAENVPTDLWFGNRQLLNQDHLSDLNARTQETFYCMTLIFGVGFNLIIYLFLRPFYREVKRVKAFQ